MYYYMNFQHLFELYIPKVGALDGHSLINAITETNSEAFKGFAEHNAEIAANAKFKLEEQLSELSIVLTCSIYNNKHFSRTLHPLLTVDNSFFSTIKNKQ